MKKSLFYIFFSASAFSFAAPLLDLSNPEILKEIATQCNAIFDSRKEEISLDLQKLQERQNTVNVLSQENAKLLKQRQEKLNAQEAALKEMYKNMKEEENKSKNEAEEKLKLATQTLEQNKKILEQIKGEKDSKLSQSYAKMKDASAAQILSNMDEKDAIDILLSLQAKQMGLILSKMQPDKAAKLTQLLQYYPDKKPTPKSPPPTPQSEGINVKNPDIQSQDGLKSPENPKNTNLAPTNKPSTKDTGYKIY